MSTPSPLRAGLLGLLADLALSLLLALLCFAGASALAAPSTVLLSSTSSETPS